MKKVMLGGLRWLVAMEAAPASAAMRRRHAKRTLKAAAVMPAMQPMTRNNATLLAAREPFQCCICAISGTLVLAAIV
jgi:hypothetical protein